MLKQPPGLQQPCSAWSKATSQTLKESEAGFTSARSTLVSATGSASGKTERSSWSCLAEGWRNGRAKTSPRLWRAGKNIKCGNAGS